MKKEKYKKLEYYLTLDRNQTLRVRKQMWRLDDGEFRVRLTINVPLAFFSVPQTEVKAEITVPPQDLLIPEVVIIHEPLTP